jgi:hypothetical protein
MALQHHHEPPQDRDSNMRPKLALEKAVEEKIAVLRKNRTLLLDKVTILESQISLLQELLRVPERPRTSVPYPERD